MNRPISVPCGNIAMVSTAATRIRRLPKLGPSSVGVADWPFVMGTSGRGRVEEAHEAVADRRLARAGCRQLVIHGIDQRRD